VPGSKAEWRRWAAGISPTTPAESDLICSVIADALRQRSLRTVLTFLAMPGEVSLQCLTDDLAFTLAVTRTPPSGPLTIHHLESQLEKHPFGFHQPLASARVMDPQSIEAVLVPGVLFSYAGGRLGHGRGYYDQLLGSLPRRPFRWGVTVERRVVESLPMTENDVWMDAIATESGLREVSRT
jgi:5-formyltetrahydrofolate cyclo-ligase